MSTITQTGDGLHLFGVGEKWPLCVWLNGQLPTEPGPLPPFTISLTHTRTTSLGALGGCGHHREYILLPGKGASMPSRSLSFHLIVCCPCEGMK